MISYIIRRLLLIPLIIFGVTIVIFFMMQFLGTDKLLSAYVNPNMLKTMTYDDLEGLKEKYGLNQRLYIRYVKWIINLFMGDLGWSITGKDKVINALASRFQYTVELALYSIVPIIFGGIWLGVKAAEHHNRLLDHSIRIFAIVGWSIPDYVFGIIVLLVFYLGLGWFPPGYLSYSSSEIVNSISFKSYTHLVTIDALLNLKFSVFIDALLHLAGPVITLSYLWWAYLLRITRSSMLEVMKKDYIRTAKAKGLSQKSIINIHAKKNALIPVTTVAGHMVLSLFMGVIIVEKIFNRPGIGSFIAEAAIGLDYASIMGALLLSSFIMIMGNLIIDICYASIDPRIRLE